MAIFKGSRKISPVCFYVEAMNQEKGKVFTKSFC
jgi:hypothetical protein